MTKPAAVRWLTYNGDVTEGIIGTIMGPNTLGEHLTVVEANYDVETNTTRVGFTYVHWTPEEPE